MYGESSESGTINPCRQVPSITNRVGSEGIDGMLSSYRNTSSLLVLVHLVLILFTSVSRHYIHWWRHFLFIVTDIEASETVYFWFFVAEISHTGYIFQSNTWRPMSTIKQKQRHKNTDNSQKKKTKIKIKESYQCAQCKLLCGMWPECAHVQETNSLCQLNIAKTETRSLQ